MQILIWHLPCKSILHRATGYRWSGVFIGVQRCFEVFRQGVNTSNTQNKLILLVNFVLLEEVFRCLG
jgi:hypothetical protein